jgi:hypothetical protein
MLAAIGLVVVARAEPPASPKPDPAAPGIDTKTPKDETILDQARMAQLFKEFKNNLLTLKGRLEKSDSPEDRQRAEILEEVLKRASEVGVENKFEHVIEELRKTGQFTTQDLKKTINENNDIAGDIRVLINLLLADDKEARLKAEIASTSKLLEQIKQAIREQANTRAMTERNNPKAGDAQKSTTDHTKGIMDRSEAKGEGKKGDAKPGDAKGDKKGGEGKGEGKNDTKEGKGESRDQGKGSGDQAGKENPQGEGKDGGKDGGKEGNKGEGKDGSKGSGSPSSQGEGKDSGKGSGSPSAQGEGKGSSQGSGGEAKSGGKGSGEGQGSGSGKGGEGKGGSKGSGGQQSGSKESKPSDAKDDGKADTKIKEKAPAEAKNAGQENKGSGSDTQKNSEAKSDPKGKGDNKAEAKGGQQSDSKGSGGSGQQGDSKGSSGSGQQSGSKGSGGQQSQQGGSQGSGSQGSGGGSGGQQKPSQPQDPGRKKIQDQVEQAIKKMEEAQEKIRNQNNEGASEEQQKAMEDLEKAKQKLEELLRQMRLEEIERMLTNLISRCQKMLEMQTAVLNGTKATQEEQQKAEEDAAKRLVEQHSSALSGDENKIVQEANGAIQILEAEGSAVAFPEVFKQVRKDMINIEARLKTTEVGVITQGIEQDVVDALQDMIAALKKAKQETQQKKNNGQPPPPGDPKQNQKLIDDLAELKMIRGLQIRVNNRTEMYHKEYPNDEQVKPEVAKDQKERAKLEQIQKEVQGLGDAQAKIEKITKDIATGKNK